MVCHVVFYGFQEAISCVNTNLSMGNHLVTAVSEQNCSYDPSFNILIITAELVYLHTCTSTLSEHLYM